MEVILLKNVHKLGAEGKIVKVKDGFARNFLIPQGVAMIATDASFKKLETLKKQRVKLAAKELERCQALKKRLEGYSVNISAQVKEDGAEIYGSVTEAEILKALKGDDIVLEKDTLLLGEPIKKLGVYDIKADIHPEVEVAFRLWVVKKA
jgi:large subunit ribosomal protein L9